MCAGESSLKCSFFPIQSYPKRWSRIGMWFLLTFGCELFCSLYQHLSSSWRACYTLISLGRGLGDFDVAHSFHPWTYVSNQITHLFFWWNYFSRNARCRCQVVSNVILHPPVHSNGFSAHLLSIVKVFAFVIEAGSFWRVGGARNCTLGFLLLP